VFGSFAEVESDGECKEEGEGCGGGGLIGCEPSFLGCACLTHCVFFFKRYLGDSKEMMLSIESQDIYISTFER